MSTSSMVGATLIRPISSAAAPASAPVRGDHQGPLPVFSLEPLRAVELSAVALRGQAVEREAIVAEVLENADYPVGEANFDQREVDATEPKAELSGGILLLQAIVVPALPTTEMNPAPGIPHAPAAATRSLARGNGLDDTASDRIAVGIRDLVRPRLPTVESASIEAAGRDRLGTAMTDAATSPRDANVPDQIFDRVTVMHSSTVWRPADLVRLTQDASLSAATLRNEGHTDGAPTAPSALFATTEKSQFTNSKNGREADPGLAERRHSGELNKALATGSEVEATKDHVAYPPASAAPLQQLEQTVVAAVKEIAGSTASLAKPAMPTVVRSLVVKLEAESHGTLRLNLSLTERSLDVRIEASRAETVDILNDAGNLARRLRDLDVDLTHYTVVRAATDGVPTPQPPRDGTLATLTEKSTQADITGHDRSGGSASTGQDHLPSRERNKRPVWPQTPGSTLSIRDAELYI